MPQSTKKIIFWVVVGVVAVAVILVLASPTPEKTAQPGQATTSPATQSASPPASNEPPPMPALQTKELRLEVLVVRQDGTYRVRDVDANTESDLFIPSDANITAGSRPGIKEGTALTVQKFMTVANGLVAVQLSVATAQ